MANTNTSNGDSIKAAEVNWSGRALAALRNGDLLDKSLSEIDAMSDKELLLVNRLGHNSLREIREKARQNPARLREERMAASADAERSTDNGNAESERPQANRSTNRNKNNDAVQGPKNNDDILEFAKIHNAMITFDEGNIVLRF